MGYTISESSKKPHRRTSSSSGKSASGDFFANPNKTRLAYRCNSLKVRQEESPSPTKIALGVHYYKYRHYKSDLGRWLGRDPIEELYGIKGFLKTGYNDYAYVRNKPFIFRDRFGLCGDSVTKRFEVDMGLWTTGHVTVVISCDNATSTYKISWTESASAGVISVEASLTLSTDKHKKTDKNIPCKCKGCNVHEIETTIHWEWWEKIEIGGELFGIDMSGTSNIKRGSGNKDFKITVCCPV